MKMLDIHEEHLEETDFLWLQRHVALDDDAYDLADLAALEERLLAHVDGLVVAGDGARELLEPLLATGEAGEAFAAATVALASGEADRQSGVIEAFGRAADETLRGLRHACCLALPAGRLDELREVVGQANGAVAAAVLDVLAFQRTGLEATELAAVLESDDAAVQAAGLRAAGSLGLTDLAGAAGSFLEHEDPDLREAALGAVFLLAPDTALAACRQRVAGGGDDAGGAQIWLGLGGDCGDGGLLAASLDTPELARPAVEALGWLGDPARIDALLRYDGDEAVARRVGLAVRRITGLDLEQAGLAMTPIAEPESGEPPAIPADDLAEGATTEDLADPVEDPDEGLPRPDPERLNAWWQQNRSRFSEGRRCRYGQPLERSGLVQRLLTGGLAERHLAARELVRMEPGRPLAETRALVWRQRRELAELG